MIYGANSKLMGAKVVEINDHCIVFDNGIRLEIEDIGYHINIMDFKEDE